MMHEGRAVKRRTKTSVDMQKGKDLRLAGASYFTFGRTSELLWWPHSLSRRD